MNELTLLEKVSSIADEIVTLKREIAKIVCQKYTWEVILPYNRNCAIRAYMEQYNCSLIDAIEAVDDYLPSPE